MPTRAAPARGVVDSYGRRAESVPGLRRFHRLPAHRGPAGGARARSLHHHRHRPGPPPPSSPTRTGAAPRGVRSLCDRLVVDGFLAKDGDRYALRADAAAFLDRSSPAFLGSAVTFLTSPPVVGAFARLTDAVRRGGTAVEGDGSLAPEHPMWVEFARAHGAAGRHDRAAARQRPGAARPDPRLGARHRRRPRALRHHPRAATPEARVVALDWPNVLAVAARERGARRRARTASRRCPAAPSTSTSARDHALVLLTNFLHHFDPPTNERLLAPRARGAGARRPRGRRRVRARREPRRARPRPPPSA